MIIVDGRGIDYALKKLRKESAPAIRAYMDHKSFTPKKEKRSVKAARAAKKRRNRDEHKWETL